MLAVLLLVGLAYRLFLMRQWRPAFLGLPDSAGFLQAAEIGVFEVPLRPAGYPIFLAALRSLSDSLSYLAGVQHLLGLATAVLLYATVVRLGFPRWTGVVAAAVIALQGSWIWLEHAILAEGLFLALAVLSLYLVARRGPAWFAAAGLAVACAAAVRTTGVILVPVLIVFCAWMAGPGVRRRVVGALACAVPAIAVLAAYLAVGHNTYGTYSFAKNDAYQSYGRVATFADCPDEFEPPPGTERLCPGNDARDRQGHDWWLYAPESPAVLAFGHPANTSPSPEQLSAMNTFIRRAVLGQPKAYLTTVARDLVRIVKPSFPRSPNPAVANASAGYTPPDLVNGLKDRAGEGLTTQYVLPGTQVDHRRMGLAEFYENVTRFRSVIMAALLVLAAAAVFVVPRALRAPAALLVVSSYLLLVFPVLTSSYDSRYVTPVLPLLTAAAAVGAWGLLRRWLGPSA